MAEVSNIINISLSEGGRSIANDNMNVCAILTSDTSFLSSSNRYALYSTASAVEGDFGTTSETTNWASKFFGVSPNPVNADGVLVVGYWRAVDEDVPATSGNVTGEQISEAVTVATLQTIADGSFDIDVDGADEVLTGLNFQTVTSLGDVLAVINAELTGAVATIEDSKIIITSLTTGLTSSVGYAIEGATGTFVGGTLGLNSSSTATLYEGEDAETLTAETKVDALSALKAEVNFKGAVFIDNPTDTETEQIATWVQANNVIFYDVFESASNLEVDITNPVWAIKLAGQKNYRCLYSPSGQRTFCVTYMSRNHTVQFNAENSALTMHLKELAGTLPEDYTQTEIDKAQRVGLDIYTTFKDVPKVFTSGANDFVDNVYNLMAYADEVQTDLFNVLGTTSTKIAQTIAGVNTLLDRGEKTSAKFVKAGVGGAGTWNSTDTFGDLDTFNRNIEEKGYYWKAGSLADQSQADREARKSPILQNAFKLAGAIHSANVIINVNK